MKRGSLVFLVLFSSIFTISFFSILPMVSGTFDNYDSTCAGADGDPDKCFNTLTNIKCKNTNPATITHNTCAPINGYRNGQYIVNLCARVIGDIPQKECTKRRVCAGSSYPPIYVDDIIWTYTGKCDYTGEPECEIIHGLCGGFGAGATKRCVPDEKEGAKCIDIPLPTTTSEDTNPPVMTSDLPESKPIFKIVLSIFLVALILAIYFYLKPKNKKKKRK